MLSGHTPRVRGVSGVPNPIHPISSEGWLRVRSEARAVVGREFEEESTNTVERIWTREHVPSKLSQSSSKVGPGIPAGYSQAQEIDDELERRRSKETERVQPAAEDRVTSLAVRTAYRPRRSKRTPLPTGLSPSIHDSSSASWMPRAKSCPQGGVPASRDPPPLDELGKPLRWNGCGCWDVLRWSKPPIAHQRGPRAAHINCLMKTPTASTPPPHVGLRGRAPCSTQPTCGKSVAQTRHSPVSG